MIKIRINGDPVAKGRPQATRTGRVYTPKLTRNWENNAKKEIALQMRGVSVLDVPVKVTIICCFTPSESWPKWKKEAAINGYLAHDQKPDYDNVSKAILDACNELVFKDDAQVIDSRCVKIFGHRSFVQIEIEPINRLSLKSTQKDLREFLKQRDQVSIA